MSGTLTQAPRSSTSHRAAANGTNFSDHLIHIPHAPRGTTPNLLRGSAAALGIFAVIAALTLSGLTSGARSQISTVGADAPSVRATNDFLFKLQDMDAQLVNALLVNGDTAVHVPRSTSESLYDQDRKDADADLESATVALAGNSEALAKLHGVTDSFGQYQAQAARTLQDDERDGGSTAGQAPASVLADYSGDNTVLFGDGTGGLMAAAKDLEQSSKDAIDSSASSASDSLSTVAAAFAIFGVLLIAGLTGMQLLLTRRFHRTVNPALAAATVTALIFTIGGVSGATGASDELRTAKSNAFDSVLALGEANAVSAGINSDESRWLLVHDNLPSLREQFEQSFRRGENSIADVSLDGGSIALYSEALDHAQSTLTVDSLDQTQMTAGSSFGKEFHNITFPDEAQKALAAFGAYSTYIDEDQNLRKMPLDNPQDLKAAIDFDTDAASPGSSDQAFTAYTKALGEVTAINEAQFESAMPASENGISTWIWLPYLLVALMAGLTVLGLRPRLNEYR